jgi:hypothetical protein
MSDSDSDSPIDPPTLSSVTLIDETSSILETYATESNLFDKLYGAQRGFTETHGKEVSRKERKREGYIR